VHLAGAPPRPPWHGRRAFAAAARWTLARQ
jgi:hypothetical protein